MATYTSNYNLSKPESTDTNASFISAYRDNMDIIDKQMGNKNIAEEYDNTQTYAVDDYVIYDGDLYKCVTAVTSAEDFDSTKWTRTVASDEFGSGGGGGGSTVTYTPTLTEGTKTGEISIDGTSTDMYAPTPITDSSDITYDNTDSGLSATNVQDAIDEVVGDIPTKTSDLNNDSDFVSDASYVHTDNNFSNADVTKLSGIEAGAEVNVQADWNEADNTADDYIKNKPTALADFSDDSTHRVVTDTQISTWNGKQDALTEGDGIDITSNVISLEYLTVVNGAVNLVFDDGN